MRDQALAIAQVLSLAVACSSARRPEGPTEPVTDARNHSGLMAIAAWYYCDAEAWPPSLDALRDFVQVSGRDKAVAIDWSRVLGGDFLLSTETGYVLLSRPATRDSECEGLTWSRQNPPKCSANETTLAGGFVRLCDNIPFDAAAVPRPPPSKPMQTDEP